MAAAAEGPDGDGRRVAVVGGGISGLYCASTLSQYGYNVTLFDMGKSAPGGRMTTRRTSWRGLQFDHGCQFIRAERPEFKAIVEGWVAAGVAAPWRGRVGRLSAASGAFAARGAALEAAAAGGGGEGQPSTSGRDEGFLGVLRPGDLYVGTPTMDAICRHLAERGGIQTVRSDVQVQRASLDPDGKWLLEGRIRQPLRTAAERKQEPPFTPWNLGVYDALVLADRNAAVQGSPGHVELTGSSAATKLAASAAGAGAEPCLALMLGFGAGAPSPLLPFDAASVAGSDDIAWVCLDSSKPGRERADEAQCVVALASPALSRRLAPRRPDGSLPPQTPELLAALVPPLFSALQGALAAAGVKLPDPDFAQAHRWGSAFPAAPLGSSCLRADGARLAACGDFCLGGGVEGAVLSGRAAADVIRQLFE